MPKLNKMCWKKLKSWLKGGIVGIVIGLIYIFLIITNISLNIPQLNFLTSALSYLYYPLFPILTKIYSCNGDGCWAILYKPLSIVLAIIWILLIAFIIGSLIGLIIEKIKFRIYRK